MKFTNPYKDVPDMSRLSSDIPTTEFLRIKAIRPGKGTIQTTINHLWVALTNACRKYGINDYEDRTRFEQLVSSCELIPRSTTSGHSTEAEVGDDDRGAKGVCDANKAASPSTSEPKSKDGAKRRGRKSKGD